MGPHHLERIEALGGRGKAYLLSSYYARAARAIAPISDPFGGELSLYRETVDELEQEIRRAFDRIAAERGPASPDAPPGPAGAARPPGGAFALARVPERRAPPRGHSARLRRRSTSLGPDLAGTVRLLAEDRAAGNVTIPHKERCATLCERRTPLAERVGAVNTFWVDDDGALVGDNTDVGGVDDRSSRQVLGGPPRGTRGAARRRRRRRGGARGARSGGGSRDVALHNRSPARSATLAERFPIVTTIAASAGGGGARRRARDQRLGGRARRTTTMPVAIESLPFGAAVVDLVYRAGRHAVGARARAACGHRASDGLPMLIEQGALAFERWFGQPAPRDAMWDAVRLPDAT